MDIQVVARNLTYRTIVNGACGEPEIAVFRYSNAFPFAVHLFFPNTNWSILRSLLVEGSITSAGEGDVQVRHTRDGVELELRSNTGHSVLLFDLDELLDALAETRALVEYDEESAAFDVDGWIAATLRRAA